MTLIQLRVYVDPGQAEVFLNLQQKDGGFHTVTAIVDTGAEVTLLPQDLMPILDYRLTERGTQEVEQAGIARQVFAVTEAYLKVFLEDLTGSRTDEFEILVWFTDTSTFLVGFDGILERAVLHVDMPNRSGYLELVPS